MLDLNKDVIFLILGELKDDKKSIYSCLFINRNWCETTVPILWKNPVRTHLTKNAESKLINVILLHLSEESRDVLKNQGINTNIITKTYQRPIFNYINFWKYLNLHFIERIIFSKNMEKFNVPIIRNEILKLFINRNTRIISLYFPQNFDYQLHHIPGVEYCFSELESFHCNGFIDQNILEGLSKICKSIKKLVFDKYYCTNNSSGIVKLIEAQKSLNNVSFIYHYAGINESFSKSLEESLIKHADTIQYLRICWKPITRILSYLVNLLSFEIIISKSSWKNHSENLSLPILKFLKAHKVSSKILANLIENTKGHLSEISIYFYGIDSIDNKRLIKAIYKNCQNLRYLHLLLVNNNINSLFSTEFKNLLINCQFLSGLVIETISDYNNVFRWDKLFEMLTESSPISLFRFKFFSYEIIELECLKLFFDNWKNRNPILLEIDGDYITEEIQQLEKYKAKGIIKKYFIGFRGNAYNDFEWI